MKCPVCKSTISLTGVQEKTGIPVFCFKCERVYFIQNTKKEDSNFEQKADREVSTALLRP